MEAILDMAIVQWAIGLIGAAFTMWVIPNKVWAKIISVFGGTVAPVMDKVAMGLDAVGVIAEGAGLEKVGLILHEGADLVDEAEDIPRLLAEYTADGDLTAEEINKLIAETGEVGVELKEFILVVKKKPVE